jgi:hypothetical protein
MLRATSQITPSFRIFQFPKVLWAFLIVSIPGATVLAVRLIYEQTILSWKAGPQMVGFAFAHQGVIIFLALSSFVLLVSFFIGFIWLLLKTLRQRTVGRFSLLTLLFTSLVLVVLLVPYGIWQSCTIAILGPGEHRTDHLIYFAATGSKVAVRTLLNSGVDINSQDSRGLTALMAASTAGESNMVEFLLQRGADVVIKDHNGKNALDRAIETAHSQTADIVRKRGARSQYY